MQMLVHFDDRCSVYSRDHVCASCMVSKKVFKSVHFNITAVMHSV